MKASHIIASGAAILVCGLSLLYLRGFHKSTLHEIPAIINDGRRPAQITLSGVFTTSVKFRTIMFIEQKIESMGKLSSLGAYGTMIASPVGNNALLTALTINRTDVYQDDIGNCGKIADSIRRINVKVTYDKHGNVLDQEGTDTAYVSHNYPDGPIKIGDRWTGWFGKDKTHIIQFRLDDIVNYHGRDLAKILYSYTDSPNGHLNSYRREDWVGAKSDDISKGESYDDMKSADGIPVTIHIISYTFPER